MSRRLQQPLTNEHYLDSLIKRSRNRSNTLGDLCKFGVEGVEIPPDKLFDLLAPHNLQDWQPVDIRPKTAARKAITRIRPVLEDPNNDLRVIVRPVHTAEPDVTRYAIIDETTDQTNLDLEFSTRNQVVFRADTGTIEFTKDTVPEILEMFNYLCSVYTDAEVNLMVKNIVNNHGCIWMNDNSGMFFMGHPHKEVVNSLVTIFKQLNEYTESSCYFRPIAILDDEENRKTMGEALIADISLELSEATDYLTKATDDKSKKSLNAALSKFKVANAKAQLYKDMLQINLTSIEKKVEQANDEASKLLMELAKDDKA